MFGVQHMMGFGWGGWIAGGLMMLLFWGGLLALLFFAIRAFSSANQKQVGSVVSGETALDILKKRYAQGEIDKVEYEVKRRDMET